MRKLFPNILLMILIFSISSATLLFWDNQSYDQFSEAKNGVLDLSHWNSNSTGRLTLSGEWEFYWKDFLTWNDFNRNTDLTPSYVKVPTVWNQYQVNGEPLPGFGYATYHLKVRISDTKTPLSLRISSMSTAYQCFINDTLVAENGKISTSPEGAKPYYKPVIASFLPPDKEFDIIIHVSNYTYARGGIWYDIDFGTKEQIQQYDTILKYKDGLVIGSLAIMAICFFCFFFIQREDRKSLSFMFMCIIMIARTTLYGDYLIMELFPGIPFRLLIWITYATIYWFPLILYQMIDHTVANKSQRSPFVRWYLGYALFLSILTAFLPVAIYTRWIIPIESIAFITALLALSKVFRAHQHGVVGARIIMVGSTIVVFTGIHDVLYQANKIYFPLGELTSIGLVIFMFLLSYLMATQFAVTYRSVQKLSLELSEGLKHEQELTDKLYAMDKLKDEFLINTSHELRTPLNGIINITLSVLDGIGGDISKIQRQNLDVILNSARKINFLISDLLDVSFLKDGGIKINPVPLHPKVLVDNLLIVFRHLKKSDAVVLANHVPLNCPMILADEDRLRQIFNNLIGNAIKFTDSGSIEISATYDENWMCISVTDTGIGISENHLSRIFNAFEQIGGTDRQKQPRTGLGLYITRQLIELHGGNIRIESELGKGTTVFFTLPICQQIPENESTLLSYKEHDFEGSNPDKFKMNYDDGPYNILVVEDDPANMKALMNILQLAGYHVKGVTHGKAALDSVKKGVPYELIVLDVMIPELSGYAVLEKLRRRYNLLELPVLLLTAKPQTEDISLCFKLGANDYLAKPFEADELLARVSSLVRLKNTVNQLVTTEMSFLQAQIKPHFIHNALSVISSLSIKDPQKSKSLILDLSDYLRGSFDLNNNEGLTTLSKELELVRAYVSIEQARFKERLQVRYHLLDEVDFTLPLLTIQPLVENAIRHGIMCKLEGGVIDISLSIEEDRVRIEVKDNGVGMDANLLETFFEVDQDRRGVGIANIHRRLMTHYGEGLCIESAPDQGTVIYFYIPYLLEKERIK